MILRWLVTNMLRQAAEGRLQEFVADASGRPGGASNPRGPGDPLGPGDPRAIGQAQQGVERPPEPPPNCDIALLFALGIESGGLADLLQDTFARRYSTYTGRLGQLGNHRVLIAETGVGCESAARATNEVIARHTPRWVISTGFAGGLVPELKRGHQLMADRVGDVQDHHWNVGLKVDADQLPRGVHVGPLLTVDHLVPSGQEKRRLAQAHGAVACDMETAAVAEICRQEKTRFMAVRIISDGLDDELPREVEKLLGQDNWASKLGAATAAIWKRPSTVKDLWRLNQEAMQASDRLARFLAGVIRQLD